MLRFYTPSDSRKSISRLYKIESVDDYIKSISNLKLDIDFLRQQVDVHEDYKFACDYIEGVIERSERVCFLSVYDFLKEAYFVNRYPKKKFLVADVSIKALSALRGVYPNVEIAELTFGDFEKRSGDILIVNLAEYFLDKKQLSKIIARAEVILNNTHLYVPSLKNHIYSILREVQVLLVNVFSLFTCRRQLQFRGWMRTPKDFLLAAHGTDSYLKSIIFNKSRQKMGVGTIIYSTMVHYERDLDRSRV